MEFKDTIGEEGRKFVEEFERQGYKPVTNVIDEVVGQCIDELIGNIPSHNNLPTKPQEIRIVSDPKMPGDFYYIFYK